GISRFHELSQPLHQDEPPLNALRQCQVPQESHYGSVGGTADMLEGRLTKTEESVQDLLGTPAFGSTYSSRDGHLVPQKAVRKIVQHRQSGQATRAAAS